MPEYLAPGVYVEEVIISAKPIEGVSTSTAGFIGEAERGPTRPMLITGWLQYQRFFGSYFGKNKYLPYAVEGFFLNGGQRCYICRVVSSTAKLASIVLSEDDKRYSLIVEANGEGTWGNRIAVKIIQNNNSFDLSVFYWRVLPSLLFDPETDCKTKPRPQVTEVFNNISIDETSNDYFEQKVNRVSKLVKISKADYIGQVPASSGLQLLVGGDETQKPLGLADYTRIQSTSSGQKKGLATFAEIDDISILYSPNGESVQGLNDEIIDQCELLKDRFAIIDTPQGIAPFNIQKPRDTKYAATYYPWIYIIDPETASLRLIPPGGHVAGIYARTDAERGVHKAPANEEVRGAQSLEFSVTQEEQNLLNPKGINCLRAFGERGIRVWGAKTLSSETSWKYVSVRRLFLYLEESIEEGTQWVVFEPNDEKLWARVKQQISQFLMRAWMDGALMGCTPKEAFFVKCDRTTMTQDDIDNGRLIVLIGVAPVKPAEFVIFRIAQWAGGSSINE